MSGRLVVAMVFLAFRAPHVLARLRNAIVVSGAVGVVLFAVLQPGAPPGQIAGQLAVSLEHQEGNRQFKVLETAVPPQMPAGPNKLKLLIIALAMASMFAAALVLLREQFDNTFHSVQDLKNFTRVPIAATIPRITTPGDTLQKGLRACFVAFLAIALFCRAAAF